MKKQFYVREVAANICDLFEDLLEANDMTIPSSDRTGDPSEARLYGEPYADLEDEVTSIIVQAIEEIKKNPALRINREEYGEN